MKQYCNEWNDIAMNGMALRRMKRYCNGWKEIAMNDIAVKEEINNKYEC